MGYAKAGRIVGVLAMMTVAACEQGQNPLLGGAVPAVDASGARVNGAKLIERDVEAPDVFQVSDNALWDGRPSLGGVWVASPDAVDPERVIMRNTDNGKSVIGALFKRERDNPGPNLQMSSDAAAALGMLAGQPAKVSVTALRLKEVPAEDPEVAPPILDKEGVIQVQTLPSTAAPSAPKLAPKAAALPAPQSGPQAGPQAAPPASAQTDAQATLAQGAAAQATLGGYIQIGFFAVKANAQRAISTLGAAGITANMRSQTSNGKTYWIVGARGDGATLTRIKAAGFTDAYLTKG